MVYFHTKNPNLVKFGGPLKNACIFYGHLGTIYDLLVHIFYVHLALLR
jgi:hypothetical protein